MEEIEVEYLPIWKRYLELFRRGRLSFESIGILLVAMMEYQFEGTLSVELTEDLEIFWLFIERDLDNARRKYESSVANGRKGGRKKKQEPEQTQQNPTEPNETHQNPVEPNKTRQNPMEGKSISESMSMSESITESRSMTKKGQKQNIPAAAGESVSLEKKTYGEFGWIRLNDEEYARLEQMLGKDILKRCIAYIDESAQSTRNRNHWFDWFVVLRRCAKYKWYETKPLYPSKPEIPKGASGELGEAELEAIQMILREG